jgi:hypothetical protein
MWYSSSKAGIPGGAKGRRVGNQDENDERKELVLVAFEGEIANLETLIRLACECGFCKVLSALVTDLQKAQAEPSEIIAMSR